MRHVRRDALPSAHEGNVRIVEWDFLSIAYMRTSLLLSETKGLPCVAPSISVQKISAAQLILPFHYGNFAAQELNESKRTVRRSPGNYP